jgi:hypothetical protein
MREISRSVQNDKQAKKNVLTVQSVRMLTWHYHGKWFGATWPRHGLPRGTMQLVWLFKSLWRQLDSTLRPPTSCKYLAKTTNQCTSIVFINTIWCKLYLSLNVVKFGWGSGWGLAPAHGYVVMSYGHQFKPLHTHLKI